MRIDPRRVPGSTYRVQLRPEFGFEEAAAIADYLAALGVTHLYASPYMAAAAGSTHGYDIVDPSHVSEELGGEAGHRRLCEALQRQGLGQVLDVVPNHMAITGPENVWWWDVLRQGITSRYAPYFDVDWRAPEARLHNKVLLPILGDHFGRVLEAGEFRVEWNEWDFTLHYFQHTLPLSPHTLVGLLKEVAQDCGNETLAFIADALEALGGFKEADEQEVNARDRDHRVLLELLQRLALETPQVAEALRTGLRRLNQDYDALEKLLRSQHYRLAYWKVTSYEINYRRFFDINGLIGLRIEEADVFTETHSLILKWLDEGVLDGVRIDHPDGLRDPKQYFIRLRKAAPDAWLVVEKILEPGEPLHGSWPVQGTTGYDFLNRVLGLFIEPASEVFLTSLYGEFTGEETDYETLLHDRKHLIIRETFGGELSRLTYMLLEICEEHRRYRDYARHELQEALREFLACFPVYRTYARRGEAPGPQEVRAVEEAAARAKKHQPEADPDLFDFIAEILLQRVGGKTGYEFTLRFQQLSAPVMAKGAEDTAFYAYHRLTALNEVGGDPGRFGLSVDAFHGACIEAQDCWPQAMLASSTHDTKRSEDVRARLCLLTEMPERWAETVRRWRDINAPLKQHKYPDANTEYMIYQMLLGAWPISLERALPCVEKALHEAKVHTSWTNPNEKYDKAVLEFVRVLYAHPAFVTELDTLVKDLFLPGCRNSLSQTLIKFTAPGVPDIYQGCELWDFSLMDPDNRRPVDYEHRRSLLDRLEGMTPDAIWTEAASGLPKLYLTHRVLTLRREHPEWFGADADYTALRPTGSFPDRVVAFKRGEHVITIAPRLTMNLEKGWLDTRMELGPGRWRNVLTNEEFSKEVVDMDTLLRLFPVGLLIQVPGFLN